MRLPHLPGHGQHKPENELRDILKLSRNSFVFAGIFSMFINLLMLTPAIYMLQLYDRVLGSNSESTLLMLTLLVLGLFTVMGVLEMLRSRILVRVSARMDVLMSRRLFDAMFDANLRGRGPGSQPIDDLTSLRQFMTGNALFGFFDAPWMPIYIAVLYLVHPWIGTLAIGGALLLTAVAAANNFATQKPLAKANSLAIAGRNYLNGNLRNAEALEAMGMRENVRQHWAKQHNELLSLQSVASDRAGGLSSLSKTLRIALQSMTLGLGAYLAVQHEITPGMMIAGSIILGRALAPIDLLIGSWKGFLSARQAYRRLGDLLAAIPSRPRAMSLPAPDGRLTVENVVAAPPGAQVPVLRGVRFEVEPGEIVGIIGPSAAGKSTLARVVLGVWPLASGKVRLSGADISQWNRDELGPYVGYLPQDIELFAGTVGENIARFGEVDAEKVVAAARRAQVHEMILRLPQGYDTPIGDAGAVLSGGQRQRIGLARAMYGSPVLVVLDEPNSNLDDQGEAALVRAIGQLKAEGSTVLLITHRLSVLNNVDKVVVLREGMVEAFGTREKVLAQFARPAPVTRPALQAQQAAS
ncbi:type I secretion system permease/ATPase [Thiorhodovibrio frisius]|uniref:Type I secretion system ABC transporter, PrtD family n=1 Tax=Thiorhodovibrio frisius TaxID=631362 RepID=H8Z1I9_9GAMM|nr:type I secretion system permease/ATPase [Thiorhodovibrio frisius]EIC22538.1 type I secretion system ABC transporter, PrtD family [Thiorhodovibrio frisius]WPL19977.1 Type I secretion system ATP-binding protein PrsD [Thiorhodovibrio frisius]